MTSPIDRARQLVALATNHATTEQEARTVALQACKLIAEHKLLDGGGPVRASHVHFAGEGLDVDGLFRFMQDFFGPSARPPPRPPPQPPPPPRPKSRRPKTTISQAEFRKRIEATYQSLRARSPTMSEPVLRRAAASSVALELDAQGVEVTP